MPPLPSVLLRRPGWPALVLGLLIYVPASAQQDQAPHVRLDGLLPAGVRSTLTDGWGSCEITLSNAGDRDATARIFLFYQGQSDVQYGRDVWVPAHATLTTWMLVGPPPPSARKKSVANEATLCEAEVLIYRRAEGEDHLIQPHTEKHFRERSLRYRPRQPTTAVLIDLVVPQPKPGELPQPETREDEVLDLVHTFRHACSLDGSVQVLDTGPLPPTPQAFEGIDHFVVASDRLSHDPVGSRALRHWLEQGGTVWVMLDQVAPEVVVPLLGETLDFQVVDRVSLTTISIQRQAGEAAEQPPPQDRPVDFVRVLLPAGEHAPYTIAGWPVWFSRPVGRGKVLFTTLGPRGWYRPRTQRDSRSPYENLPDLPVPLELLNQLASEIKQAEERPVAHDLFESVLAEQIGYTVIGLDTVGLIFGLFFLVLIVLGLVLRRTRRPELVGWLTPAVALATAAVFLVLGVSSRHAAPATVAVIQLAKAVPGQDEIPLHGELAVYRPEAGAETIGSNGGGFFELDMAGLEGQIRRFLVTDLDRWHWENVALPAGVRHAPFHYTLSTSKPLEAVAHFGPDGLEGKLTAGPFPNPGDALLLTPADRLLALHFQADGSFHAGSADVLPPGQFLQSPVLSDRQQRRQRLYRDLLPHYRAARRQGEMLLLAWADPVAMPFQPGPEARLTGSALLAVPLRLEHLAAGRRVTVPGPLVPYRRLLEAGQVAVSGREFTQGADLHLRFQLPAAVLPLKVERARLIVKINAPSRRVIVSGRDGEQLVELRREDSPLDPIRVDIADERLLHLDAEGGLHLNLTVSNPAAAASGKLHAQAEQPWRLEYAELEVSGTASGRR
jgi:hypothetical protein